MQTRKSVVRHIEDGETVSAILWDAHRDPDGTVTGIDPATWCPVTITNVLDFHEGGEQHDKSRPSHRA